MALYDITYRCGHKDTVRIYGTNAHGEREKKAAWYGTIDCPDCKAAKTRQANKAAGMAELEGSDKQIAWAEDIRAQDMAEYARQRQKMADHGSTDEQLADADQLIAWLKHKTSARWWIIHNGSPLEALYAAEKALAGKKALETAVKEPEAK